MDDTEHDNDFPDLSSFDDESSVISVSAIPSLTPLTTSRAGDGHRGEKENTYVWR